MTHNKAKAKVVVDWEAYLIPPPSTITLALERLINVHHKCVFVVGDDGRLLGSVSDGDIRRGLLCNIAVTADVSLVMELNPSAVEEQDLPVESLEAEVPLLPIVNNGFVVGVLGTDESREQKNHFDNPVFIMAGGFGRRLRPLTDNCPKPMLDMGGKPLLQILIEQFRDQGFYNFYISTYYLKNVIQDYFEAGQRWGVSIKYIEEESPLGTGGALGLLPVDLNSKNPVIVINGDILTTLSFSDFLSSFVLSDSDAMMCVREHEYQVPYGVVKTNETRLLSIEEKPIERCFVNAGIYILDQAIIRSVEKEKHLDLPTVIEQLIARGGSCSVYPLTDYWLDIGRHEDFLKAKNDAGAMGFL